MEVQVNFVAVGLATLSSFVVGGIWYAKPVFGNTWAKLVKLDDAKMKAGAAKAFAKTAVMSFLTAYVLAHVTYLSNSFYTENSFLVNALMTGFWVWLGFQATAIMVHDAFEQRATKLTIMNIGNQLFTIMAMALVIGMLKP